MMNKTIRAAALLCALGVLWAPRLSLAQSAPRTVNDYYEAMQTSAAHLDAEVADRQRSGDMAAAQRIALAAGMVRRTAEEFRGTEQEYMQDEVGGLNSPIPERVEAAVQKAKEAELAVAEHAAFIDEAQLTFNALLAALPQKTPHPILYGMLVNDLTDPAAPLPSDIVFFGFRLVDPIYKTAPTVQYGKTEFPASAVTVKDDRIEANLPEAIKNAVHYAPPPCMSRPGFGLRAHFIFAERHGYWPLVWHTQTESNVDLFAMPTPMIYSATITTSSQISATTSTVENFEERSSVANVDCEQSKTVEVRVTLPAAAQDAKCTASWVDATGATKLSSRCQIEGQVAHAVGQITAGAKVCSPDKLCTCSVPAQAWLEARGAYRQPTTTTQLQMDAEPTQVAFAAGGIAELRIAPREGRKLRDVALSISRRACATVLDTIDLVIGDDPNGQAAAPSASGEFRASIKAGDLKIGASEAFTKDARNGP
jgi:hypothetical protein